MTTTTPKLNAIHFMMLDVHEPLSSEEINSINQNKHKKCCSKCKAPWHLAKV